MWESEWERERDEICCKMRIKWLTKARFASQWRAVYSRYTRSNGNWRWRRSLSLIEFPSRSRFSPNHPLPPPPLHIVINKISFPLFICYYYCVLSHAWMYSRMYANWDWGNKDAMKLYRKLILIRCLRLRGSSGLKCLLLIRQKKLSLASS
jgi:hypothetical protein